MRKTLILTVVVLFCAAVAFAVTFGKIDLKEGDEIYACNCGADCPCQTMAKMAGNCTCGKEMVKAKVVKLEDGVAMMKADAWDKERSFKTVGKYACACGEGCKCGTISQNPGKCVCGNDLKKVE